MELLKNLTQCDAPSGNETTVTELIKNVACEYADEIYTDTLGNLIVHKKGNGKKIMYAAHADEIGIVVTYIDKDGFLRFSDVGGLYTKKLFSRKVRFLNGVIGIIGSEKENDKNSMAKMYIDIGATSAEEAEKMVSVGDMAVFVGEYDKQGDRIISKALDNRCGCYVLLEALKRVKSDNDLYFCFTSQEEVGLRGARTCAYEIDADYAIAVDVTDVGDTPKCDKNACKLGEGAAIKVMDYSVICSREVREKLVSLAKENDVKYQMEVMTEGGTDAGVMLISRDGVLTGGISIPTRYIHSPCEMIDKKDLENCITLAVLFAENA